MISKRTSHRTYSNLDKFSLALKVDREFVDNIALKLGYNVEIRASIGEVTHTTEIIRYGKKEI